MGGSLIREARLLASVNHPSIVRIDEASHDPAPGFLALEYCPGGSLQDLLEEHPRGLELERVVQIAVAVLEALLALHGEGIVHRDLKPSNILFDERGRVKVCDFGIGTQSLAGEIEPGEGTQGTELLGTPYYLSPEEEDPRCPHPVSPRSDLYSLGKVIFAMLTGRPPRIFRPLEDLRKGLDPAWNGFILSLTEEDPERRPDAAEALAKLREIHGRKPARERSPWFWPTLTGLVNLLGSILSILFAFLVDAEFPSRVLLAAGFAWAAAGYISFDLGIRAARGRKTYPSFALGGAIAIPLFFCGSVLLLSTWVSFRGEPISSWPLWARVMLGAGIPMALLGLAGSVVTLVGLQSSKR